MRRRKKGSKKKAQKSHLARRMNTRFGIHLTDELLKSMLTRIQNGKAHFVEKQSNRVSLFKLEVQGEMLVLVYDKERKSIVTAMYENEEDRWEEEIY